MELSIAKYSIHQYTDFLDKVFKKLSLLTIIHIQDLRNLTNFTIEVLMHLVW